MSNQDVSNETAKVKKLTEIDVSTKSVHVIRTTKHGGKDTGIDIACDWTLDFNNLTDEQIYELAVRSAVIDYQRLMRDMTIAAAREMAKGTMDVSELFKPRERGPVDPVKQAQRAFKAMSEEQRAELIAQYAKADKGPRGK